MALDGLGLENGLNTSSSCTNMPPVAARMDGGLMSLDESDLDWTGCDLVERIPGKVSGRPLVRGTRILATTIVQDAELGSTPEEIKENYPDLSLATIRRLLSFASSRRAHFAS